MLLFQRWISENRIYIFGPVDIFEVRAFFAACASKTVSKASVAELFTEGQAV